VHTGKWLRALGGHVLSLPSEYLKGELWTRDRDHSLPDSTFVWREVTDFLSVNVFHKIIWHKIQQSKSVCTAIKFVVFPCGNLHRKKDTAHSTQTRLTFQMIQKDFVFSYQTNYRALHYLSEGVVYCCSDFQSRARNLVASASVRRRSKLTYKVFGGCKLLLFADEKGVPKRQVNIYWLKWVGLTLCCVEPSASQRKE